LTSVFQYSQVRPFWPSICMDIATMYVVVLLF
jgi:hypothetical protein